MSTMTQTPVAAIPGVSARPPRTRRCKGGPLIALSWRDYQAFQSDHEEEPLRFTYDSGSLEIMPTSYEHELYKWLLGHLLETWADEMRIRLGVGGSMTL